jgi:Holliday junction resolvasome RuvABC endonuclease subunit
MIKTHEKYPRILAFALSSRGFGFAVFEGQDTLVNWGGKRVKGNKNEQSLAKAKELISYYRPEMVVLENTAAKGSRRARRIQALTKEIATLAVNHGVRVKLFSREQVKKAYSPSGVATKHDIAELVVEQFPEELGARLPPKRKAYTSEDSRMDIFDAVALTLTFRQYVKKDRTRPYPKKRNQHEAECIE